ncbi:MAG: nucleotide exchange factor GrpE [Chloroflexota bacterium]
MTDEMAKTDGENISETVASNPTSEDAADVAEVDASPTDDKPNEQSETEEALNVARAEAQKNHDRWQRALADFDNYKKRTERDRVETYENAAVDIIKSVLPILDDFERAMENVPEDVKDTPWLDGTSAIGRKLNKLLETYEIEAIDPVGEPFDPDKHQGLGIDESSDVESGHVTVTLQKGYIKGEKLLRPALVRVAG